MVSFLDWEGTDPQSAAQEAAEALTDARHEVEAKGIKSFLFNADSVEEFDQRVAFREVSDILGEVADSYLGSREGRAKITAALRREFEAQYDDRNDSDVQRANAELADMRGDERCRLCGDPLYGLMRVHHHNDPETGQVAHDDGSSDPRCQLCGKPLNGLRRVHHHNDPETGVVAGYRDDFDTGSVVPGADELRDKIIADYDTKLKDPCGGCPAGTKCVCTHAGCTCVKTSQDDDAGLDGEYEAPEGRELCDGCGGSGEQANSTCDKCGGSGVAHDHSKCLERDSH